MSDSLFQNSYYVAVNVGSILYGVEVVLYILTLQALYKRRSRDGLSDNFLIWFSTASLILITIYEAVEAVFGQEMWVVNADYPGGQAAYMATYASVWYQTMGSTATVILELMTDGLMIYRCFVVWDDYRVVILPCFLWFCALVLGVFDLYVSGAPNGNFFTGAAANIGVSYFSISIGNNILATCLICGRILYYSSRMRADLGPKATCTYTGVLALIVESALPFSLSGFACLVSYGLNSEIAILFITIYTMFTCISPQLLILRVISGEAWTRDTTTQEIALSTVDFSSRLAGTQYESEGTAFSLQNMNLESELKM
ncbi:hypothetical protein B0H21DRAFT_306544 [Amylocystis lapponica]|nr:hypothetical protein B0H21DRAFT_306544 [Amylocystis lapponica]